ncbi:ABC transporter permease [Clostridium tetanomorphum]|uniref:ABC transporter permease n=1 Tax=Clostridium tetanomorphum TaxID=1553 RepID=A0A923E9L9_CLOTT|nr:ABC transporter permease [Clostridium tetanomorphum]
MYCTIIKQYIQLIKQYRKYIKGVLKGNLGTSLVTNNLVSQDIGTKMKPTILGISVPNFWFGYILLLCLSVKLSIFKVVDYGTMKSLILPSFTFALPVASSLIRILRSDIISEFGKDYYIYAKARGIKGKKLIAHVIRNALPPVITMFFQNVGFLIGGSAIIESVFSWPGFGGYFVKAILERDLPAISGCVLAIAIIFVFCNWLSNTLSVKLNPIIARRE